MSAYLLSGKQPEIDGKSIRGYGAAAFRNEDAAFREAFNIELDKLKKSGLYN